MTQGLAIPDAALGSWREGLDNGGYCRPEVYNDVVRTLATLQIDAQDDYKRNLDEHSLPLQPTGKPI